MDITDTMGNYGCLQLMKRSINDLVTAYPIDNDQVTFGCDPTCHVRLYYDDIDSLHCKLIFRDRKAFMVVFGKAGLIIDGCLVQPLSSIPPPSPTTVPIPNNTELIIHNKRFVFSYPPKDKRYTPPPATPAAARTPQRKLRLSMIKSAEVFTPGPSPDPKVNLKILKSPVKGRKSVSGASGSSSSGAGKGMPPPGGGVGDIILVRSDRPRVLEEEKDLVIFEDEPLSIPNFAFTPVPVMPVIQPQTPVRRPVSTSLHRAVLLRSTQRAVIRHEEEEEEKEVAEVITQVSTSSSEADYEAESEDDGETEHETEHEYERETENVAEEGGMGLTRTMTGLRKSLGVVWPFRSDSGSGQAKERGAKDAGNEIMIRHDDEDEEDEEEMQLVTPINDKLAAQDRHIPVLPPLPRLPALDGFMTPHQPRAGRAMGEGRYSLGGAGRGGGDDDGAPQRVMMEAKWKIKDILVPVRDKDEEKHDEEEGEHVEESPIARRIAHSRSEEERKAIRERRKSALQTPDTFFGGCAPGMGSLAARASTSFAPPPYTPFSSPEKVMDVEESAQDTGALLAKMKQTLAEMQRSKESSGDEDGAGAGPSTRRMSLAERMSLSPKKRETEWGKAVESAKAREVDDGDATTTTGIKDLFARPVSPSPAMPKMKGLKAMFERERKKTVDTPTFEGLDEMMMIRTTTTEHHHDHDDEEDEANKSPVSPTTTTTNSVVTSSAGTSVPSTTASSRSTSPPTVGKAPPAVVKEETAEPAHVPSAPVRARFLRSKKPAEEVITRTKDAVESGGGGTSAQGEKGVQVQAVGAAIKSTRKGRKANAEVIADTPVPAPAPVPTPESTTTTKPARKARTTKKTVVEEETTKDIEEAPPPPATQPARKTRTTKVPVAQPGTSAQPKTSTRRGKAQDDQPATTTTPAGPSGRRTPASRTKSSSSHQKTDSVDSVENENGREEDVGVPVKKGQVKSRSRTTTTTSTTPEPRGRSATPVTTTTSKTAGRSTRSAKKVVTRESTPEEVMDKENAPRSKSGSVCEEPVQEKEKVVVVTRTRKTTAKVKEEPAVAAAAAAAVEPTKTRTRTRTRT